VTFTNKAAAEMRERIAEQLGMTIEELRRDGPWIGTFHSICARILRRHGEAVGLSRNFSIYDVDDQRSLMRRILKALNIDPRMFSASAVLGKIDSAKNLGLPRSQIHELGLGEPVESWTRRAWAMYEDQLRSADAADFGDLLVLAVELLRKARPTPTPDPSPSSSSTPSRTVKLTTDRRPAASSPARTQVNPVLGLRRRFLHVVVDEYQDTNPVQAELVDLLCGPEAELCVVGDDDQAIYGWRGADVRQILAFPETHYGCEIIRLEQNYRSTSLILDCANAVIQAGVRRHDKKLWSEHGPGEPVQLVGLRDEREEARWVARTVSQAISEGESPAEIVVFYRTHAQSRPLEEAMRLSGIRYRMLGGIRFYDRREIKDLIAYLRLLTNPAADLDCLRIINVPARRIGAKTIERLTAWAIAEGKSLLQACGPDSEHGAEAGLGKPAVRSVAGFWTVIEALRGEIEGLAHHEVAALVLERVAYFESITEEQDGDARTENLNEFIGALEEFVHDQPGASLAEYLEQIALATSGDDEQVSEAITMMTIHSAKGLEFDRVFVTGMEEGVFPHMRAIEDGDPSAIEEERRLAYVALTRARRRLSLSHVERRFLWGRTQVRAPSRFLTPLPELAIVRSGLARKRRLDLGQEGRAPRVERREPSWDDDIELDPGYAQTTTVGRASPRRAGSRDRRPVPTPPTPAVTNPRSLASVRETELFDEPESDTDLFDEPEIEYEPEEAAVRVHAGMLVRHPKFGVGKVLSWTGTGDRMKLNLSFAGTRKTILARFCAPV